jgi:phage baseplate assembly protein W
MVNTTFFNPFNAMWPDLVGGQAIVSPPRNGVNRKTGQLMQGWDHVQQSMEVIFATPFHERILRRWVGSFVPHILGKSAVPRIITRFFWAIVSAIDLWEPDYRIKRIYFMGDAINKWTPQTLDATELLRLGNVIFRQEGVWMPRGHLGDFTPYSQKQYGLVGRGGQFFDAVPLSNQ